MQRLITHVDPALFPVGAVTDHHESEWYRSTSHRERRTSGPVVIAARELFFSEAGHGVWSQNTNRLMTWLQAP